MAYKMKDIYNHSNSSGTMMSLDDSSLKVRNYHEHEFIYGAILRHSDISFVYKLIYIIKYNLLL